MRRVLILALLLPLSSVAQQSDVTAKKKPAAKKQQAAPKSEAAAKVAEESKPAAQAAEPVKPLPAKAARGSLATARTVRLTYGLPAWNRDSKVIDSATLIMREGNSGRLVQIHLEETEPDSAVFSGLYSVAWGNIDQVRPEFYIPPQNLVTTGQGMKKVGEMIASNSLGRKPFVLRREKSGLQNLEVFDTREQAKNAMQAYRAEQQIVDMQNKKLPSEATLESARMAKALELQEAAAKNASERVRISQVERAKLIEQLRKFGALSEAEQLKRRQSAAKLAEEGIKLYAEGKFPEAQKKFDDAIELDPTNKSAYFQYGVTLYRNEQFNRSIVFLELAEGANVNPPEKAYYLGLNFHRLKDFASAEEEFETTKKADIKGLSSSAAFYQGLIRLEQTKYKEAQASFQEVLDRSDDPRLDEQAEAYIEQILRLQQFEAEKKKRVRVAGTLGMMSDSNILLTSDSALDQGTATDSAGIRMLATGTVEYRPVYSANHEWSVQADLVAMYTRDDSFGADQTLRNSDPYMGTLTAPYRYKGLLWGKGYKMEVIPGFETISMSVENNEQKPIMSSYIMNWLNTIVVSDKWFTSYNLELRKDNSLLDSATGANDSSAFKTKFAFNNIIFANKTKGRIVTADISYTINAAEGDNVKYRRTDLAVGYIAPTVWDLMWNAKLSYFLLSYDKNPNDRADDSYTLSTGFTRKLTDIFSAGVMGNYNVNNSTVDANSYKKWTLMTTISATHRF